MKILPNTLLKNKILNSLKINSNKSFGLFFKTILNVKKDIYINIPVLVNLKSLKLKVLKGLKKYNFDNYIIEDRKIYFIKKDENYLIYEYNINSEKINKIKEIKLKILKHFIIEKELYFLSVNNFEDSEYRQIYKLELSSKNRKFKKITSDYLDVNLLDYNKEKNYLVYTAFKNDHVKNVNSYIYYYDILKQKNISVLKKNYRIDRLISNNDKIYFEAVNLDNYKRNDNQQIYQLDIGFKDLKKFDFIDYSNENYSVITDVAFAGKDFLKEYRKNIYSKRTKGIKEIILKLNSFGKRKFLDIPLKTINDFIVLEDESILCIGLKENNLLELYHYKNNKLNKITNMNNWINDYLKASKDKITLSKNKYKVEGWVVKPTNFDSKKTYPAILMIHGGPKMIYSDVFSFDVQMLANEGYFIFYCNPRGSDGKGNDFADIRGNYAKSAYNDLMDFTDKVLSKYNCINPKKLGVTGGSYGGYMTNYIITKTNRFKVAVSERGISNLVTAFTSSDIGDRYMKEYMNGLSPWDNMDKYFKGSPINFANLVKTPTLFIHGKDDKRCNYTESLNMYKALLYHSVDSNLCLFKEENHSFIIKGKPTNRVKRNKKLLSWMDKYLKKGG